MKKQMIIILDFIWIWWVYLDYNGREHMVDNETLEIKGANRGINVGSSGERRGVTGGSWDVGSE